MDDDIVGSVLAIPGPVGPKFASRDPSGRTLGTAGLRPRASQFWPPMGIRLADSK